ncbi:hypothetical protein BGZ94_007600 [Podila epigama]|nr:hypothetical protein BGZ94_007600 [Podila epigama]
MLANKTFLIAAIATFMAMATTSVQAAPSTPDLTRRCVQCDKFPDCGYCPPRHYCDVNYCSCTARCKKGMIP